MERLGNFNINSFTVLSCMGLVVNWNKNIPFPISPSLSGRAGVLDVGDVGDSQLQWVSC